MGSSRHILLGTLFMVLYATYFIISHQLIPLSSLEDGIPTGCNLDDFVLGPAINQSDPCFVAFFKKTMLTAPRPPESVRTIAFSRKEVDVEANIEKLKWVQMLVIDGSPKDTEFFFVESGAHDGRFLSTTLRLETLFGWNGVLIEPQPKQFEKVLRNRKVWAVNAALCVTPHPDYVDFYVAGATSKIVAGNSSKSKVKVPCVPFYTILKALNVSVVDYLSLDIEGAELQVLKTVPFDRVMFKVMIIEYAHIPGTNKAGQLVELLKPQGYHLIANITMQWSADLLFVHNSVYREKYSMIEYVNKNRKLINSLLLDDVRFKTNLNYFNNKQYFI